MTPYDHGFHDGLRKSASRADAMRMAGRLSDEAWDSLVSRGMARTPGQIAAGLDRGTAALGKRMGALPIPEGKVANSPIQLLDTMFGRLCRLTSRRAEMSPERGHSNHMGIVPAADRRPDLDAWLGALTRRHEIDEFSHLPALRRRIFKALKESTGRLGYWKGALDWLGKMRELPRNFGAGLSHADWRVVDNEAANASRLGPEVSSGMRSLRHISGEVRGNPNQNNFYARTLPDDKPSWPPDLKHVDSLAERYIADGDQDALAALQDAVRAEFERALSRLERQPPKDTRI
jgi:hypothetical protein